MKENFRFAIYASLSPLLLCIGILLYLLTSFLYCMMFCFCVFFFYTVLLAIRFTGLVSLYSIYLYTSSFFIYNSLILSLFTKKYFLNISYPWPYKIEEHVGFVFIICCFVMVYFGHLAYMYFRTRITPTCYEYRRKNWEWIGTRLFLVSLIPVCYKIFLQLQFVRQHGYLSIYSEGFDSIKYPFWCLGAFLFFNSAFYLLFAANPPRKKMLKYICLYFLVSLLNSLKGGRGPLIAFVVVIIFLYKNKYGYKLRVKSLLIAMFFIIALTSILGNIRSSYGDSSAHVKSKSIDLQTILINTLWSQTSSRTVPLLIIRGDLKYHPYPFIFYPFTNRILSHIYKAKGNEIESLEYYNNPSQVLMGNVSVSASLSGMGYGSAIIGEAYECGAYFGIAIFSILVSILIVFLDNSKLKMKNLYLPFWYVVLTTIPGIPRKEIFQFIIYNLNDVVFFYVYFFLLDFIFFRIKTYRVASKIIKKN